MGRLHNDGISPFLFFDAKVLADSNNKTRTKPEDFTPYQLHSGRVSEIGIEKIADSTDKTEQLLTEQWVTINEFSDAKLKQYFEFAKENAKRIADASLAR